MKPAGLIARSPSMRELLAETRRFAAADANILILGETGAGKDAVARALHALGPRRAEPFVTIDCPGLPRTLVESELFGHERGAFTDAGGARAGRFEAAGRGTVYLDNVHELPLEAQAKLLRVVEQKTVERLGSTSPIELRARVIASADERIEQAVQEGSFRDDLYHRLRVLPLRLPPLRDRKADILPLARAFLRETASRLERPRLGLTAAAEAALGAYPWPGNIRQLRNVLERAVLALDPDGRTQLDAADLPLEIIDDAAVYYGAAGARPTLEEVERRYLEVVLREARGNQTKAARILGISRKALWEKRRRFSLK